MLQLPEKVKEHPFYIFAVGIIVGFGICQSIPFINKYSSEPIDELVRIQITEVTNVYGDTFDQKKSPYQIYIKGTLTNTKNYFVYLIVDDFNVQIIQTGLGAKQSEKFSGICYLGTRNDVKSINKPYKIFAVVTNKKYAPGDLLDRETIITHSRVIELFRTK